MIIDFLRRIRDIVNSIGQIQIFGFHVDVMLHFFVAFILTFVLRRWFNVRKTSLTIIILIISKEIFDIFAKSKIDYIRPPGLDIFYDIVAGLAGIFLGIVIASFFSSGNLVKKK